jgi:polyphenol oxidase
VTPPPSVLHATTLQDPEITAFFSTRHGGVSEPPFHELNLSSRDDDPASVAENMLRVCRSGGLGRCPPALQRQVHGCTVTWVGGEDGPSPGQVRHMDGDALVTRQPRIPVAVLVADCVPVLLWDPVQGAVAAVHAGWRGTAEQVVLRTLESMADRIGTRPGDVRAAIGPAIGGCCYDVGPEVVQALAEILPPGAYAVDAEDDARRVDLRRANEATLLAAGVTQESISTVGGCTCCGPDFFSYRRDGPRTGRQMGVIERR